MKIKFCGNEYTLEVSHYFNNNNLALVVHGGEEEPYEVLTVNLGPLFDPTLGFVDTNNFPEAEQFIKEYKLGEPTGITRVSGFCVYPLYKFDMEEVKKYYA